MSPVILYKLRVRNMSESYVLSCSYVSARVTMADFPCGVCKNECDNDVIQCHQCETWFHHKCLAMTKTVLKSWATRSLSFFCRTCSFVDGLYDAEKALRR